MLNMSLATVALAALLLSPSKAFAQDRGPAPAETPKTEPRRETPAPSAPAPRKAERPSKPEPPKSEPKSRAERQPARSTGEPVLKRRKP